jgi:hypothetical protein
MALYSLNDLMDFDHVIRITDDGTVEEAPGEYAPEVYVECADDDAGSITREAEQQMIDAVANQGWELMTGYTGQYSYRGPIMHASEYVGGQMEADIRATPGLYVVIEPTGLYATEEQEQEQSDEPIGWVVARKVDQ